MVINIRDRRTNQKNGNEFKPGKPKFYEEKE
jgi:hypothetical protein